MSTAGVTAGTTAAAAAAAVINATLASGVIVKVEPGAFLNVVDLNDEPAVVCAQGGFFSTTHKYLTSFRGLAFYTTSRTALELPGHCLIVQAKKIWVPH